MDLVIRVSVLTFVGILIFCIISIIISRRKFRRELKSQMEDINRRQMGRMRDWTAEDYRQYEYVSAIHRSRENLITEEGFLPGTTNLDDERSLKPNKHIKRHSIR